ncbi:MAG: 16S rRNA (uracil(1498)-N(3))-methyltransferase [Acidobacteria bacterium]|nr:16S rRNA (uracil(1498)-N(3))-methyltransferase [Acidobacteriota bacterium]
MSRRRFYVPRESVRNGVASLPSDQAHHLRDVLRMGSGEIVEIFDGTGNGYVGEVELQDSGVYVRGLQNMPSEESPVCLILAAAMIKFSKFEWILQKATELGVHEIIPLKTRLSEADVPGGRITLRLERWDRIVREAAKQCHRFSAPRIHAPRTFQDFLSNEELSAYPRLLFYEKAAEPWIPDPGTISNRIVLCIGPEGGWDAAEVEQAKKAGYKIFSMGPWILRAETAAIAAVAILQHHINLLSKKS